MGFFVVVTVEYMRLPASQYSVLDAERIERVDENTFRCYIYRIKFFAFEVCPVLLVRVEEQPNGCCISLLSCKVSAFSLYFVYVCVCVFFFWFESGGIILAFVLIIVCWYSSRGLQWLLRRMTNLRVGDFVIGL